MDITNSNLSALFVAIKTAFNKGLKRNQTYWQRVATEMPSSTGSNKYTWLGEFPSLREWIGDRVVKDLANSEYSITNKDFESTIGIPRNAIDDDEYGQYMPLFESMGDAVNRHPDQLVFGLLKLGFTTTCYDGQNFFDTDHPVGTEETGVTSVSNLQAGAGAPWFLIDDTRPLLPIIWQKRRGYEIHQKTNPDQSDTVFMQNKFLYGVDGRGNVGFSFWQLAYASKGDLDTTNFNAAMAAMGAFKSDAGEPLGIRPTILVVGPSNRAAAKTVVAQTLANGAANPNYNAVEVVEIPWLA